MLVEKCVGCTVQTSPAGGHQLWFQRLKKSLVLPEITPQVRENPTCVLIRASTAQQINLLNIATAADLCVLLE